MFKRKLWFNITPGKDPVADLTFHFPQVFSQTVSPKARRVTTVHGFHAGADQVPEGASQVHQEGPDPPGRAALQDPGWLGQIPGCHNPPNAEGARPGGPDKDHDSRGVEEGKMRNLVGMESFLLDEPSDHLLYFIFCSQHISSSYDEQSSITAEEAKIRFLKVVSTWPTFGCSFFEAKVTGLVNGDPQQAEVSQTHASVDSSTANVRGELPQRHLGGDQ